MYKTQEKNMNTGKNESVNDIHEAKSEEKLTMKLSPYCDNMFRLKRTYTSPRILSKSVPRRNKPFVHYRIARSLSFDVGSTKHNNRVFKSPNSSLDSSFEEDKRLSRSNKIMKALNFSYGSFSDQKKKIKRSLNFNLSPSPRKLSNSKSPQSVGNVTTSPIKLNRTLNFDSSPSDSSSINSSILLTSLESMDENQNQTPSQRGKKGKMLLDYVTPTKGISPSLLRQSLKEKIDGIVQSNNIRDPESQHRNSRKSLNMEIAPCNIGTPRNLYSDLCDENERPKTPENTIRVIPESMSAIKKSHKKERSLRYTEEYLMRSNNFINDGPDDKQDEQNICDISKDSCDSQESKDKQSKYISDDDFSDTGSIFDYSMEKKNLSLTTESDSLDTTNTSIDIASNIDTEVQSENTSINTEKTANKSEISSKATTTNDRSITPENHVNRLQVIQADSIKKSHRKLKDQKKKKVFLPVKSQSMIETDKDENVCNQSLDGETFVEDTITINKNCLIEQNGVRASTPEDINSSRLLLSQFSSVKKSHKKDKHNNIVNEFIRRQKHFQQIDNNDITNTTDSNTTDSTIQNDVKQMDNLVLEKCSVDTNDRIKSLYVTKIRTPHRNKRSPSKRKVFSDLISSDSSQTPCDFTSGMSEYENNDFQIFTPIKKRKSFLRIGHSKISPYNNSFKEDDKGIDVSRCVTPTFAPIKEKYNPLTQMERNDEENIVNLSNNSEGLDCQDTNGRSTPQNMSTIELLANLNSIKKSHKKDKRGHGLYQAIPLTEEVHVNDQNSECSKTESSTSTEKIISSSFQTTNIEVGKPNITKNEDCMEAMTSMQTFDPENADVIEEEETTGSSTKTPPNCSMIKSYMKLLQTTSIKKSHRKIRNQRRSRIIVDNSDLSDDGSIYGEEEKIESLKDIENQTTCSNKSTNSKADLEDPETATITT